MTSTHSNHGSHSNNALHQNTSGLTNTHSVSFSNNSGFANNKLEGSLKTLITAMNNVRNSMQTPNSLQSIPSGEKISSATVPKIINNVSGLASRWYRPGTFNMNAVAANVHKNSSSTGTRTTPVASHDLHASSGGSVHGNTTNLRDIVYDQSYSYDVSSPSGKALLEKRNEIFNAMNGKKISSNLASFSYSVTGSTHANHSSHRSCSRKMKKDILFYEGSALEVLEKTKIVSFRYIDDPDQILHYGFIAEDTDSALATEFHDRMDYTNCIGLLIRAVQELKQEVDRLKSDHSI